MMGTRKRKGMLDDICSAEEVVLALLQHFVEPFLPSSRATQAPTPSQHRTIATQMHAVVVLYNYYHRKRYHEHEFLDFTSFCKLAVVLKPNLMAYMKLMHQADYSKMDDLENELSQTEKAILNACNVSTALDASKSVPVIDGWPMSKVAVFLVNLRKENCMLLDSAITHGVISVIEKDLDVSSVDAHDPLESKCKYKQTGAAELILKDTESNDGDGDNAQILDWAFSAVKNAAGINKSDLVVLESYIIYSLNRPKAAARLYLMQCIQPNNDDIRFHIKDIIESLQGPLVKRSSCGWMVTPVVKYFHMLPYTEALSDWISREVSSNLLNQNLELVLLPSTEDQTVENSRGSLITQAGVNSSSNDIGEVSLYYNPKSRSNKLPRKKDSREFQIVNLSEQVDGPVQMDVHGSPQSESESQNSKSDVKVYRRLKNRWASSGSFMNKADTCESVLKLSDGGGGFSMDSPLPQASLTSGNAPSHSFLAVLCRLKQKLCEQLETVEAEILQCDKDIDAALNGIEEQMTEDADLKKEEDLCEAAIVTGKPLQETG